VPPKWSPAGSSGILETLRMDDLEADGEQQQQRLQRGNSPSSPFSGGVHTAAAAGGGGGGVGGGKLIFGWEPLEFRRVVLLTCLCMLLPSRSRLLVSNPDEVSKIPSRGCLWDSPLARYPSCFRCVSAYL
jgi:hypothetical protein